MADAGRKPRSAGSRAYPALENSMAWGWGVDRPPGKEAQTRPNYYSFIISMISENTFPGPASGTESRGSEAE